MAKIAILGTGAWGTALANVLLTNKNKVNMWGIDQSEIDDLKKGYNKKYFGNVKLPNNLNIVSNNLYDVVKDSEYILLAIPSKFLIEVIDKLQKILVNRKVVIINVAKGFDIKSRKSWSQVIEKKMKKNILGVVSLLGPSFAEEVFHHHITLINAVGTNKIYVDKVSKLFTNHFFKTIPLYVEVGPEIFAALKNVAAIGAGIVFYYCKAINTRVAMLTATFQEIILIYKKICAKNYNPNINFQLCSFGDFTLTCSSDKSRNFHFGKLIAKDGLEKAHQEFTSTTEGYNAAPIIHEIIKSKKIKAPIITAIYQVLYEKLNPEKLAKHILK